MNPFKLLVVADTPTAETGFGRVVRNLLPHWVRHFPGGIDVWGIGYYGWPHTKPCRIFPASGVSDPEWQSQTNLHRLLTLIANGDYTHVWIMQDLFHVARFAKALRGIAADRDVRTLLYFPVDAPVPEAWAEPVRLAHVAVAYTRYGFDQLHRHLPNLRKIIIPHGTDREIYRPADTAARAKARAIFTDVRGKPILSDRDFLISVVGAHQKRKGIASALQVFEKLIGAWPLLDSRPLLYLHMPPENVAEGSDLKALALEMGLQKSVLFADGAFVGNVSRLCEKDMALTYQAADLLLTTTHGEGWGLPITEAMACGIPVAGPNHTSVAELLGADLPMGERRGVLLPTYGEVVLPFDNMRRRPVVDAVRAAELLARAVGLPVAHPESLPSHALRAAQWQWQKDFNWSHIAEQWTDLMFQQ